MIRFSKIWHKIPVKLIGSRSLYSTGKDVPANIKSHKYFRMINDLKDEKYVGDLIN